MFPPSCERRGSFLVLCRVSPRSLEKHDTHFDHSFLFIPANFLCIAKAWRAHVLFRHSDQTHCQRGIAETLQLCNMEPPTTDLDTLDILHQTLERMDGHEGTLRDVWEKAAKTKPQDLEIQMRWFTYAFEDDAWKSAQKVGSPGVL